MEPGSTQVVSMGAGPQCKSEQNYTCNSVALSHHNLPGQHWPLTQTQDVLRRHLAPAHGCSFMLLAESIYRGYGETEAVMDVGNIMVTGV